MMHALCYTLGALQHAIQARAERLALIRECGMRGRIPSSVNSSQSPSLPFPLSPGRCCKIENKLEHVPEIVASLLKSLLHTEERFLCIALSSSPVLSLGIAHERGGAMTIRQPTSAIRQPTSASFCGLSDLFFYTPRAFPP